MITMTQTATPTSDATMVQKRLFSPALREPEPLTFLSNGAGQDSSALLIKLIHEKDFRDRVAPGRLIVITADTGDEHRPTLYNLVRQRRLCRENGIEFFFVTRTWGFHSEAWQSLQSFYDRGNRIGSRSFPKACTDNLKIKVIYRFLGHYLSKHYGVSSNKKDGFYEYTALTGERIQALIGISAEEQAKRLKKDKSVPIWMNATINRRYPLIDLGWSRADCQDYIRQMGYPLMPPSLCRRCPYKSPEQTLLTSIEDRPTYKDWVRQERNKLQSSATKFPDLPSEKNHGVFGANKTLDDVTSETRRKYAHLSEKQLLKVLQENRMNHGHCVGSKY